MTLNVNNLNIPIIQRLIPQTRWPVLSPNPMPNPHWIVVHGTGNDATASNEIANMTNNNGRNSTWGVSFHFAVDDREIIQGLPLDRHGWHASDGNTPNGGNRAGIAIEICFDRSGGPRYITAEQNTAALVAHLLRERNWGIDRVRTHQSFDPSRQNCPRQILNSTGGFNRFLDLVRGFMNESNSSSQSANQTANKPNNQVSNPAPIGTVTLKNGNWNVRALPNMQAKIVRTIQANTLPIIARNSANWVQLSCNGWVEPAAVASLNDPTAGVGSTPSQISVGSRVFVNGRLASNSNGGGLGRTLNGSTHTVSRIATSGSHRFLLDNGLGWVQKSQINLPGQAAPAPSPAPAAPPQTARPSQNLDEIARQVIRGSWGNGEERRRRLAAAGHDAGVVQARVNEMLRGQN